MIGLRVKVHDDIITIVYHTLISTFPTNIRKRVGGIFKLGR